MTVNKMNKTILLIDNDEYSIMKIEEYFTTFGFQIPSTKNGQFGLSAIRSQKPDLILLSDGIKDIEVSSFLERKKRMKGAEDIPVIIFTQKAKLIDIKLLIREGAVDTLARPVVLEKLRKIIFQHMHIIEKSSDRHLITEVFIREGIIIIEIGGFLVNEEITALKYRILDTARLDQTLKKRFYIIIYNLEEEIISQIYFDKLFEFISYFPHLPDTNVKILTSNDKIIKIIKKSPVASRFEIVDNYIGGLNKLKSAFLENEGNEVLVEFLKPNVILFKNVYDKNGILIKEEGKSFSLEELEKLLERGIKKLCYTRKARVGTDKQIMENENLDVVMDSIQVTGIVMPEELKDLGAIPESKKRFSINILIVNDNEQELKVLDDFFTGKGFAVTNTVSSKGALGIIAKSPFDYIIIDLDLDNGNGLNLVKSMKLIPKTKNSQFIITGKIVKNKSVEQAIHLGVRGFLKSPFDPEKLSQIIK